MFFLDTVNSNINYWGSSLHHEHDDVKKSNYTKVYVKALDISKIIDKYSKDDYVILKIDIEGSEFALLEHLIERGTIFKIDYIAIEFHWIFKNDSIHLKDKLRFYKTLFKIYNITYSPWYLEHNVYIN